PAGDLPRTRFLGYLQNHDQIGNRPRGERSSHLMSTERLKIGAALVFTSPFVPMLFQGEEWGASTPFQYFTDHQDPDLAEAVSKGRWQEFAAFGLPPENFPDPQDPKTFERSKLKWEEIGYSPHREILEWHRHLIELRKRFAGCQGKQVTVHFDAAENWLVFFRGPLATACNLSHETRSMPLEAVKNARVELASAK